MISIFYNVLGFLMLTWYAAIRWTMYTDKIKYAWAYTPINLTTAFLSIAFIIPSLFLSENCFNKYMYCLAIFIAFRNMYYIIEDVIDYPSNPKMQAFDVAIDIAMLLYTVMWIVRYLYGNSI